MVKIYLITTTICGYWGGTCLLHLNFEVFLVLNLLKRKFPFYQSHIFWSVMVCLCYLSVMYVIVSCMLLFHVYSFFHGNTAFLTCFLFLFFNRYKDSFIVIEFFYFWHSFRQSSSEKHGELYAVQQDQNII